MRYFLLSYTAINNSGSLATGNAFISTDSFPNNNSVKDEIEKHTGLSDVVIFNIYQFPTKKDYLTFCKS